MKTLLLIELLLKYGPTLFIRLMRGLKNDNPTVEEIRALQVKGADEFFE